MSTATATPPAPAAPERRQPTLSVRLIIEGVPYSFRQAPDDEASFEVRRLDTGAAYTLTPLLAPDGSDKLPMRCTCRDHLDRRRDCKHILAVRRLLVVCAGVCGKAVNSQEFAAQP